MNLESIADNDRRNVHLFDCNGTLLAGLLVRDSDRYVTKANFYEMCEIVLDFQTVPPPTWAIFHLVRSRNNPTWSAGGRLLRDYHTLSPGKYVVLTPGRGNLRVTQTSERAVRRWISGEQATRSGSLDTKFRDKVRNRDRRCMITGVPHPEGEDWGGYQSTHIWPLARESTWRASTQLHGWITDTSPASEIGISRLYSPQNGLLMKGDLHTRFDLYKFAINPDDGYKITYFAQDIDLIGGRRLHRNALYPANSNHRVSDGLLRWHFRQAVLKNMKGAVDVWPDWEHDAGGGDYLRMIREGPAPEERMELELFDRLEGFREEMELRDHDDESS